MKKLTKKQWTIVAVVAVVCVGIGVVAIENKKVSPVAPKTTLVDTVTVILKDTIKAVAVDTTKKAVAAKKTVKK